jgi:hypothetical protein
MTANNALLLALLGKEVSLLIRLRRWSPKWLLTQLLLLEGDVGS